MEKIDLSLLHSNTLSEIKIDEAFSIPKEMYQNTDIKDLLDVSVNGVVRREVDDDDYMNLDVCGTMILLDSISMEEVSYPFSFKVEGSMKEILGNCPNSLDILELLWENIVLEIPLKFTKVEDLSKFHGDGWRLVSEDNRTHSDNPFSELLKDFGEE